MRTSSHAIVFGLVLASISSACGGIGRNADSRGAPISPEDSVRDASSRLYTLVSAVDRVGREAGGLPSTLSEVGQEPGVALIDPWAKAHRYSLHGNVFEIRSAGRDGTFDSVDDIIAIGRLGRAIPCEIQQSGITMYWDDAVPRCGAEGPESVYRLCPALSRADRVEREVPETTRDSMMAMGRRLVRVARAIDGFGREIGVLPTSLRGPVIWARTDRGELLDLWGTPVRYSRSGTTYELRSLGPDRQHQSNDDIVTRGQLGTTIPCEFHALFEIHRCSEPPPNCL